jgi:hypothetical protein
MLSSRAILVGVQSAGGVLAGRDRGHKRCRSVLLPLFTELPRRRVFPETGLPEMKALGSSVNSARSRSYEGGYGPVGPGPLGPGLRWFPRMFLPGSSVNRGREEGRGSRPAVHSPLRRRAVSIEGVPLDRGSAPLGLG